MRGLRLPKRDRMWSVWPLFFISIRIIFDQSHCQNIHFQSQNHCFKECTTFRQKYLAQNVRLLWEFGGWQNSFWTCWILTVGFPKKVKYLVNGKNRKRGNPQRWMQNYRIRCKSLGFQDLPFTIYLSEVLHISLSGSSEAKIDWHFFNNKDVGPLWHVKLLKLVKQQERCWYLDKLAGNLDSKQDRAWYCLFCLLPVLVGNNSVYMDDVDV